MTMYHCCLDIRGMIKNGRKHELALLFRHPDGKRMTADEAKDKLLDAVAEGYEVLPYGPCDNFDFQKGCQGHQKAEATS